MNRHSRGAFSLLGTMSMIVLLAMMASPVVVAETKAPATEPAPAAKPASSMEEALKKLKLPGVHINLKERCVDVDGSICLDHGALELVVCTKNTKEHEAVIAVDAKAKHIHTALLLLGAKAGNPAMRKPANKEKTRWIHLPPMGGNVDVSVVFTDKQGKLTERPIKDFIKAYTDDYDAYEGGQPAESDEEEEEFPTNTFLFAGSILHGTGDRPRRYLADQSGNVITLATFGDELLCLPGVYSHAAGAFAWQVDDTHLPKVGTKVKLRLRPQQAPAPKAGADATK